MRLVIVGGSAHSTPHLFAGGFASDATHVTLAARSTSNREAVARAIRLLASDIDVACTGIDGDDFLASIAAADVVIVQFRVGGYDARTYDETFPLDFGMCGDEGLGPGGLAAAWRTWPVLEDLLATIVTTSSKARVILLTSPIGVLTRAALDAFPQLDVTGICELPFVTLGDVTAATGTDMADTDFTYAGVNHLGWFTSIVNDGRDLVDAFAQQPNHQAFPAGDWIRAHGTVPLKYLRLHYERDAMVREQRASTPRGIELGRLQEGAFAAYARGDRDAVIETLAKRPAPWYAHAVAPLLRGLGGEPIDTTFFLTVRNEGYLSWLPDAEVVEVPHRFSAGALVRARRVEHAPEPVRTTLDALVAYERAASAAVRARDGDAIETALERHPWVAAEDAAALASAVTSNAFR